MSTTTLMLSDELYAYLLESSIRELPLQRSLRDETARGPHASMQISVEQGQFLALLVKLIGARNCIEVGVFTGYSALSVALALPENGRIIACDVSERWTSIARRYWREAGVADKIDLRIAPALDTLDALLAQRQAGHYDFAFIDADKENYQPYYERLLELIRPGGLIAVDNVLWGGSVIDASRQDVDTNAIRDFNRRLKDDMRIDLSLIPIGDGLTLARRVK